jgi:hypothetical protein
VPSSPRCPLCNAEALYVGLSHIECATLACANHRPDDAAKATEDDFDEELAELLYESWCDAFAFF